MITTSQIVEIHLDKIDPNPDNLRPEGYGADDTIAQLAQSMKHMGLLQPVTVRPLPDGRFSLSMGHRRFFAAQSLDWTTVPAVVADPADDQARVVSEMLVENMQRLELNPVDQYIGMIALVKEFGMSKKAVADTLGVSKQLVDSRTSWAKLPDKTLDCVRDGLYTTTSANKLASCSMKLIAELTERTPRPSDWDIEMSLRRAKNERVDKAIRKVAKEHLCLIIERSDWKPVSEPHSDDTPYTTEQLEMRGALEALIEQSDPPLFATVEQRHVGVDDVATFMRDNPGTLWRAQGQGQHTYWSMLVSGTADDEDNGEPGENATDYDRAYAEYVKADDYVDSVNDEAQARAEDEYLAMASAKLLTASVMHIIDQLGDYRAEQSCERLNITIRAAGPVTALRDWALENKTNLVRAFASTQLNSYPLIKLDVDQMERPDPPKRSDFNEDGSAKEPADG